MLHQNQLTDAISNIQRGLKLAESGGYRAADSGQVTLTLVFALQKNSKEARTILSKTIEKLAGLPAEIVSFISIWIAHAYLLLGDLHQAEHWLNQSNPQVDEYYQVTLARLHIQQTLREKENTSYQRSLSILNEAIQLFVLQDRNGYLIEALNLRAITRNALGKSEAASTDLKRALALAEREKEIYAFIIEGPAMRSLLEQMPGNVYVQLLLEAFPGYGPRRAAYLPVRSNHSLRDHMCTHASRGRILSGRSTSLG